MNSSSRPGFTRTRTTLKAVMVVAPLGDRGHHRQCQLTPGGVIQPMAVAGEPAVLGLLAVWSLDIAGIRAFGSKRSLAGGCRCYEPPPSAEDSRRRRRHQSPTFGRV